MDENISVPKKHWMAMQIFMVAKLMADRVSDIFPPAYIISKESFSELGKWMLDNNIHLVFGSNDNDGSVEISLVQEKENDNGT